MSYEQAMKYFPPDKQPTREEWDAAIRELEAQMGPDCQAPSIQIPYAVHFLELKRQEEEARAAQEERRHRELMDLFQGGTPKPAPDQPTHHQEKKQRGPNLDTMAKIKEVYRLWAEEIRLTKQIPDRASILGRACISVNTLKKYPAGKAILENWANRQFGQDGQFDQIENPPGE